LVDAKSYDLIVIGSGPGGYVAGATAARWPGSFKRFVETPHAMLL
jgi:thioredoxin reductase